MIFPLNYGKEIINITVPDEKLLYPHLISPRNAKPIAGEAFDIIKNNLDHDYINKNATNKIVGIVINDEFRSGLQKEILLNFLEALKHTQYKEVRVFIANGTHSPESYTANLRNIALSTRFKNLTVFHNNCYEENEYLYIGKTSLKTPVYVNKFFLQCEFRLFGHEAKFHYMAGYSTIDKMILPGLSFFKSVEYNHKWALEDTRSAAGRNPWHPDPDRRDNPFSADAKEARQMADNILLDENFVVRNIRPINYYLDMFSEKNKIYAIKSGKIEDIEPYLLKIIDNVCMFELAPARYVVISPGPGPASTSMYGVQNCFDLALNGAIQPGGEALVIAPCNGKPNQSKEFKGLATSAKGKQLFWDNLVKMRDWPLEKCEKWIHDNFVLYLWKTDRVLKLLKRKKIKIYIYTTFLSPETLMEAGFYHCADPQKWVDERVSRNNGKFNIINNGNKILVLERRDK